MSFFKKLLAGNKSSAQNDEKPAASKSSTADNTPSPINLSASNVLVKQQCADKSTVLELVAKKMLELGYVSDDYLQAIIDREQKVSTYLINGVAIPHGTVEAKHLVQKTGLVIIQLPQGVTWSDKGETVKFVVGIAAAGQDHLSILQKLTTVVMDEPLAKKLGESASVDDIIAALGAEKSSAEQSIPASDLSITSSATIVDASGMHARPASLISETAASYKNTDIRLRNNDRMANAKSMADLLTMGAIMGDEITVSAEGDEAGEAVNKLVEMINAGLDNDADGGNDNANYNPLESLAAIESANGRIVKTGSAASPGIAMAAAYILKADSTPENSQPSDLAAEVEKFSAAITTGEQQLSELQESMQASAPNEAAIFKAQKQLLADESIIQAIEETIKKGNNAAWSSHSVLAEKASQLLAVEDERIKARAADMQDVAARLVKILLGQSDNPGFPTDHDFILIARELTPSQTAHLSELPVKAICTELGGPNSHMAILARALGIPAIVGVGEGLTQDVNEGELTLVDPQGPCFVAGPDEATQAKATKAIEDWRQIQDIENAAKHEAAITLDGHEMDVVCNIATPSDAPAVLENGGAGVGLLRTEFLFEASKTEPTVEEQTDALKEIVKVLGSRQLVVRTADIGGDKPVSWLSMPEEDNPFLGIRGIRLSFKNPQMFRNQLEAIYRTAMWQQEQGVESGIHIMFPMIAKVSEWRRARDIAEEVRSALNAPKLKLGIMIEVPAAAIQADHFATEVDFFSVGSNDMTQYVLAMDRLHPELAKEADSYSPALLRLISMTVEAAEKHGKWVGVCGNMAADPDLASVLIGLGVKELSVSAANVPALKLLIRSVSYEKLKEKAKKALQQETGSDVRALYKDRSDLV
ncbi:phosphoenolpyruvate--protein phosphotransferase [Reinekea thalattae]|uniref:phosphoenolpyruvate--protein phosphotransferase n=1 Tax=Reinekea thalattae TaxID=2593301 RepID=A0A5C8ZA43_9GAMM|nr:phosphoenolpyruvate--protein phosphotransferase [Reinekea thalattae]TXR54274.1 phosphoenolpyruvate--protein phosphotransferase [Reinekea thalattae]